MLGWIVRSKSPTDRVELRRYSTKEEALRLARAEADHRGLTPSEDGLGFADETGDEKVAVMPDSDVPSARR